MPVPGAQAVKQKGWWSSHQWLILRRFSQAGILALFLLGPVAGIWIIKGSLGSSLTLDILPLTDPFVLLQSLFAGHLPEITAVIGAAIILVAYWLAGGRAYCSWVCPVNIVTDLAAWCRRKLGITGNGLRISPSARYWILSASLLVAALTGVIVWELLNPVTMVFRGLLFGMGMAWILILGIFLFDLFVSRHGWCGHLCPMGAFYSLPGRFGIVRISASGRDNCNDCMDCFTICPEPQVIKPALKPGQRDSSPLVLSANCTNCFRCIDVCSRNVFRITTRFDNEITIQSTKGEAYP